jgi:hypothetical protein
VRFLCQGKPGVIDVCAKVCECPTAPVPPVLQSTDWTQIPGNIIRFHLHWINPSSSVGSTTASGTIHSQQFGAFAPNFGEIGPFNVPAMPPNGFFDVFVEVPLSALPPEPPVILPGGGPAAGSPCPPDTSWSGNVDIMWAGPGGPGNTNYHFTQLLVKPGFTSHVHALIFCSAPAGALWSVSGLCPGWTATLLNENFTPAPNPVPANWTGWISVGASGAVPSGAHCCFQVAFVCEGQPGVINVCADACAYENAGVPPVPAGVDFGIYSTAPNPTRSDMTIAYAMPKAGNARLDIYTLNGQRVRTLLDGPASAGMNSVRWDGRGENGRNLPPGAYFVMLKSGERLAQKKVVLIH